MKLRPRVNPGSVAIVFTSPVSIETVASEPLPDSKIQSFLLCHLGEWGIDKPLQITLFVTVSIITPATPFFSRQPNFVLVCERALTYLGMELTIAMPLRWQRSSGARSVIHDGFHTGWKL